MTVNWITGVWYFGERGSHNRVLYLEKSWRENVKIVEGPGVNSLGLKIVLNWRVSWTGQRILDGSESLGLKRVLDWRETWTRQRVLLWRDSLDLSRESWIGQSGLEQAYSFVLEKEARTRQGALDWRGSWTGEGEC